MATSSLFFLLLSPFSQYLVVYEIVDLPPNPRRLEKGEDLRMQKYNAIFEFRTNALPVLSYLGKVCDCATKTFQTLSLGMGGSRLFRGKGREFKIPAYIYISHAP